GVGQFVAELDDGGHLVAGARLQRVGPMPWSGRGFVLVCQCASKLNGIGTLLQSNDQPVLQCPHVSETSSEPPAGPSGTPRIAAEGDDALAGLEKLGAARDKFVKVCEEATKEITKHIVEAHVDGTVGKSVNNLPANVTRQHLANDFRVTTSFIQ